MHANDLERFSKNIRTPTHTKAELENLLVDLNVIKETCKNELSELEKRVRSEKKCEFEPNKVMLSIKDYGDFVYEKEIIPVKLAEFKGHKACVNAVVFWPDNKLISCSDDKTIKIWNVDTGKCLHTLLGHTNWVFCLALIGVKMLASGSEDGSIRVWSLEIQKCKHTLETENKSPVLCLCLTPNGWFYSLNTYYTCSTRIYSLFFFFKSFI